MDLGTDDPAGLRLIDRRLEVQLEVTRRTLEAAGGRLRGEIEALTSAPDGTLIAVGSERTKVLLLRSTGSDSTSAGSWL